MFIDFLEELARNLAVVRRKRNLKKKICASNLVAHEEMGKAAHI